MIAVHTRRSLLALTVLLSTLGCEAAPQVGSVCAYDSECSAPLRCRIGRCREQCLTHVDCAAGGECIDDEGVRVCRVREESTCDGASCGTGFVCAGAECRRVCSDDASCVDGTCGLLEGSRVCVRRDALADGGGPDASMPDAGTRDASSSDAGPGAGCSDRSECAYGPCMPAGCDEAIDLALGNQHTCVLRGSGQIDCAGSNVDAQLALPVATTGRATLEPIAALGPVAQLVASRTGVCTRSREGVIHCWGTIASLGTVVTTPSEVLLSGVSRIAAGDEFVCGVGADALRCWGVDDAGELGDSVIHPTCGGGTRCSPGPVVVDGIDATRIVDLDLGAHHGCVVLEDGSARCWGADDHRQLGAAAQATGACFTVGTPTVCSQTPVAVATAQRFVEIACGGGHTCARTAMGEVWCWGWSIEGQTGLATFDDVSTPTRVTGLTDVAEISAGGVHTCARRTDGSVWCWGSNYFGQLGIGALARSATPARAMGVGMVQVELGADHTCARTSSGAVRCWGRNSAGQLGTGSISDEERAPVEVRQAP